VLAPDRIAAARAAIESFERVESIRDFTARLQRSTMSEDKKRATV
jgi:hypothetical protein